MDCLVKFGHYVKRKKKPDLFIGKVLSSEPDNLNSIQLCSKQYIFSLGSHHSPSIRQFPACGPLQSSLKHGPFYSKGVKGSTVLPMHFKETCYPDASQGECALRKLKYKILQGLPDSCPCFQKGKGLEKTHIITWDTAESCL